MRVTIKDCIVQTFRAGGKGGQNQNKRDTGVRVIHPPSGARGESREERSQAQNKSTSFRRMAESQTFQTWARGETLELPPAASSERIRSYNLVDRRVVDHRTGHHSSRVDEILDGDIDLLYRDRA